MSMRMDRVHGTSTRPPLVSTSGTITKVTLDKLPGSPVMYVYGDQDIVSQVARDVPYVLVC